MQYQYIGMNYISGDFYPTRPDFGCYNAFTKEPMGYFPQSTHEEIKQAIDAATKALPQWEFLNKRNEYFQNFSNILEKYIDIIAETLSKETGKNLKECHSEVVDAIHILKIFYKKSSSINNSKNIIGIITPSCFSFPIIVWSIVSIIFEGNTVVFNPGELSPITGQTIAELFQLADLPPGVFNLTHGDNKVATILVNELDKVTFIGNAR